MDRHGEADQRLVDFLLDPGSYPERPVSITYHETHISRVFVGDRIAYKIKKHVDFGFLDFTILDKRHFFCRQEVILNSRLAPGIYLGVVPVFEKEGEYSFRKFKGSTVAEYAVKMARVPEERLLATLINEGRLLYHGMCEVARILGRFHRAARVHRSDPYGGIEAIRANTEENFEQIKAFRGIVIEDAFYSSLVLYTREFLDTHRELFEKRKKGGLVREGHGDLHSQHICLLDPPIIVDCIEFNKRFRISDVLDDMAFLLMDVEYAGRFDLSTSLTSAYFSTIPEAESSELLCFYKTYRAVVRGKIEGFTAHSVEDEAAKAAAIVRARNYYLLARYYVEECRRQFNPVVVMGVSGSGKSAISEALLPGARLIRSDDVRKEIAGVPRDTHVYVDYGRDIYGPDVTAATYRAMGERAVSAAGRGERVILDATFLESRQRLELYEACTKKGLNPFFLWCFADPETLKDRVKIRQETGTDISDAHVAVLERQLRTVEEPSELPCFRVMRLNTLEDRTDTIKRALRSFL